MIQYWSSRQGLEGREGEGLLVVYCKYRMVQLANVTKDSGSRGGNDLGGALLYYVHARTYCTYTTYGLPKAKSAAPKTRKIASCQLSEEYSEKVSDGEDSANKKKNTQPT